MNKTSITIPCKGYEIAADWYAQENTAKILLVIVGYASSKKRNADFIAEIAERSNVGALALDLSGHGESPFALEDTTPAQHAHEVITTFDWLRAKYPKASISVMGTSYGGYMAAWLSRFRNFDKLILRTPAIYRPEDFYTTHANIEKAEQLAKYRNDESEANRNPIFLQNAIFTGPTLLVTHDQDEDIPPATSNTYKTAYNAKTYVAHGFRHAFGDPKNPQDGIPAYKQALVTWLTQ